MKKFKLTISYEGTRFFGWQRTKMGSSVQESVENILNRILQAEVVLEGASRTDRGVHAEAQIAHFSIPREKKIDLQKLQIGLNGLLPQDIRIAKIEEVEEAFHATLNTRKKIYRYALYHGRVMPPFKRHFAWHFPQSLDREKMGRAAAQFLGTKDFSAFCNQRKDLKEDKVRTLFSIQIKESGPEEIEIFIEGDHFLYKMVRNIVGTLVYVGCGKLQPEDIPGILEGKDRRFAGMTAPAQGLFLKEIIYSLV